MARDFDGFAAQPPSPTLTNPDMILPFNLNFTSSSPPRKEYTSTSLLANLQSGDLGSSYYSTGRRIGALSTRTPPPSNNRLSSTLSDIAEVETTPRKSPSRVVNTVASSPTLRDYGVSNGISDWRATSRERRSSDASDSVLSEDLDEMKWPGFDSQGGIDEESVGLDEEEEKFGFFPRIDSDDTVEDDNANDNNDSWLGSKHEDEDDEDDDPLSRRADMILANAKKRLNLLEGNLRGARHSLLTAPSSARPTPYPSSSANNLRNSYINNGPALGHRARQYSASPLSSVSSFGHSRNQSETDIPSPAPSIPAPKLPSHQVRASSALGSFAGGLNSLERSTSLRGVRSQEVMRESRLQSWMEESPLRQLPNESTQSLGHIGQSSPSVSGESPRPASALELRTQMDELKGRIFSLKERAQEDKKKRLSTSSMRTPSPFATSESWYNEGDAYKNHAPGADANVGWSPNSSPIATSEEFPVRSFPYSGAKSGISTDVEEVKTDYAESHYQDAEETLADQNGLPEDEEQDGSDLSSDEGDLDEDSTDGNSEYYETVPVMGERHEDRADAFDYENFFLHSAMGSFTRERASSFSSEDSIETTRPVSPKRPATAVQMPQEQNHGKDHPGLHRRSVSINSISTVASFQTAVEEPDSDSDEDDFKPPMSPRKALQTGITSTYFPQQLSPSSNGNNSPTDSAIQVSPMREQTRVVNGNAFSPSLHSPQKRRPISALVSSFLEIDAEAESTLQLEQDRALVGSVIESLQAVCLSMQKHDENAYERRSWRRRLDAARRALDGEYEAQAL